jgi:hypothetical protein
LFYRRLFSSDGVVESPGRGRRLCSLVVNRRVRRIPRGTKTTPRYAGDSETYLPAHFSAPWPFRYLEQLLRPILAFRQLVDGSPEVPCATARLRVAANWAFVSQDRLRNCRCALAVGSGAPKASISCRKAESHLKSCSRVLETLRVSSPASRSSPRTELGGAGGWPRCNSWRAQVQ